MWPSVHTSSTESDFRVVICHSMVCIVPYRDAGVYYGGTDGEKGVSFSFRILILNLLIPINFPCSDSFFTI